MNASKEKETIDGVEHDNNAADVASPLCWLFAPSTIVSSVVITLSLLITMCHNLSQLELTNTTSLATVCTVSVTQFNTLHNLTHVHTYPHHSNTQCYTSANPNGTANITGIT